MLGQMQRILGFPRGRQIVEEEVAYVEFNAEVNTTQTVEASATVAATLPETHFDGKTVYLVEFYAPRARCNADGTLNIWLFRDGVSQGLLGAVGATNSSSPTQSRQIPLLLVRRLVPPGGRHAYSIRITTTSGDSSVYGGVGGVGALVPGRLRLLRVGGLD